VDGIGPVQDALNQLGYTINLGANKQFRGFFGEKTEGAIEAFQRAAGISIDGRVGQETIVALDHALGGGAAVHLAAQPLLEAPLPKRLPGYAKNILAASQGVPWHKAVAEPNFEQYIGVMPGSFAVFSKLTEMPVAEVTSADLPDFGTLGISIGDIGIAFWENAAVPFVIGDEGPPNDLGEGSIKMAADLGFDSNPSAGGSTQRISLT
jgi:hypothetical protein